MWGESSKNCEINCQCSGLITDNFKINSGNSAQKRKQDEAFSTNFKLKMHPHSLKFSPSSPKATPSKRRILGEITNNTLFKSPITTPLYKSPVIERLKQSPLIERNTLSPVTSKIKSTNKISRIFEERTRFKMDKENKENIMSESFMKLDVEEETRDCSFGDGFLMNKTWSNTKLDFTDALQSKLSEEKDIFVPETDDTDLDSEFATLHDLEQEFESDNFDQCTKYEIISTDSPDIISRGRESTSRKVTSRNFVFGAPLADSEQSTSFNRPNANATRMLNFEDESFEFTSPPVKKPSSNVSVKKSLKFTETPTKNPLRHEKSDSSIGSMSSSPASSRLRIFTSESTTSMESGFISELEEPFLDIDEASNSPKVANFNDLLSGQIKDNILVENNFLKRPSLIRSLSLNPESKARVSLFSILESPKKSVKRLESREEESVVNKRRKQNPEVERLSRPVLHRAYSENNASIMSALARSAVEPDLVGDFSQPFALPLTAGHHADLKSISCDTLAALLRGEFDHCIEDFQVIDCRYPYEFEGGHVRGARNLYTRDLVRSLVHEHDPLQARGAEDRRRILVFHCEFSLERGPNLSRFLRAWDREHNMENYPHLHYPEVYLLHEGYRAFYHQHPEFCTPAGYTAMLDPKHKHSLRRLRSVQPSTSKNRIDRNRLLL